MEKLFRLRLKIISFTGTLSHLLEPRKNDKNPDGLFDWTIDTVHFWGESPVGEWQINVLNPVNNIFVTYYMIEEIFYTKCTFRQVTLVGKERW